MQCNHCRATDAPWDAEFGLLPGAHYTMAVRRAVCYAAATTSYVGAQRAMMEYFGLSISAAQISNIAHAEGNRFSAEDKARREQLIAGELKSELSPETLVMMVDATSVTTRKGQEHKMVTVVRAFDLNDRMDNKYTPSPTENTETIEHDPVAGTERTSTALPQGVTCAPTTDRRMLAKSIFTGTAEEGACAGGEESILAEHLVAIYTEAGGLRAENLVIVADGNTVVWEICAELFPNAIFVQDIYHVSEHLSEATKVIAAGDEASRELLEKWKAALRASKVDSVLDDLKAAHKRLRSPDKRKLIQDKIRYLQNARERLDYARYLAMGLPIGSGPIEAACKHVVKTRFGLTGARWCREELGYMLSLRLAMANDQWDSRWPPATQRQLCAA